MHLVRREQGDAAERPMHPAISAIASEAHETFGALVVWNGRDEERQTFVRQPTYPPRSEVVNDFHATSINSAIQAEGHMGDVGSWGSYFGLLKTNSHVAFSSFNEREVFDIAALASRLPGGWLLEWNEDCVGNISAILSLVDFEEHTLLFYRQNALVHLTCLSLDTHEHIASATQVQLLWPFAERMIIARGWASRAGAQAVATG